MCDGRGRERTPALALVCEPVSERARNYTTRLQCAGRLMPPARPPRAHTSTMWALARAHAHPTAHGGGNNGNTRANRNSGGAIKSGANNSHNPITSTDHGHAGD